MFRLAVVLLVILSSLPAESGITFMRLSEPVVQQRLRLKADSPQQKLQILRKQLESIHINGINVSEQLVPGQVLPNLVATIPGKEPGLFIVAAPTGVTNSKAETEVQWGTMLLLPMLAESIASVPTRRSIVMLAFPNTKKDALAGLRSYLLQLDPAKRSEVRAIVLLGQLGRTRPLFWVRQPDSVLANWVQLAAEELGQGRLFGWVSTQWPDKFTSVPPFIQLWSSNEEGSTFRGNSFARTKIEFEHYYNAYQLLCVLLLELDQRAGDDLKFPTGENKSSAAEPKPSLESVEASEARSLLKALADAGFPNVEVVSMPELRNVACSLARNERLATSGDPWKNPELIALHGELVKKRIAPRNQSKSEYELSDQQGEHVHYALLDYSEHPGQLGAGPAADLAKLRKRSITDKLTTTLLAVGACVVPASETPPRYWIVTLLAGPQYK